MSSEEKENWIPLSIEEERFRMYPDHYHIFENLGRSDENKLPEPVLTEEDVVRDPLINHGKIRGKNSNESNDNYDEEEDDYETKLIKQREQDEQEQFREMRSAGIFPYEGFIDSKKTAPCVLSSTQNRIQEGGGLPVILDDSFFKFSPPRKTSTLSCLRKQEDLEDYSGSTASASLSTFDSNTNSVTNGISNVSLNSSTATTSTSSSLSSFSKEEENLRNKPKSIHEILKLAKTPPPQRHKPKTYFDEFPQLGDENKKQKKKKSKTGS